MRTARLAGAALACVLSFAAAPALSDEPPPGSAPGAMDYPSEGPWTGWYIGGHLGGAFRDDDLSFQDHSAQQNLSFSSDDGGDRWLGGVHGGFGWQSGRLYFGIEGDSSWARRVDYLASVRGRVGIVANPRWLVYGTAGIGFIGSDDRFTVVSADDGTARFARSRNDTGFVGGVGTEYALNRNLTLGVEGLWYDFGGDRHDLTAPWGDDFSVRNDDNFGVVRARLTWYVNG
jgi:outer membrane immunogenic protein